VSKPLPRRPRVRTSHRGTPTGRVRPGPKLPPAPAWRSRLGWSAVIAVVLLGLVWLLWPLFSMLFAAAAFAYLLDPVVDRFEARGRSREFGIACIFLGAALALILLLLVVVPSAAHQVSELSGKLSGYMGDLTTRAEPYLAWVEANTGYVVPYSVDDITRELGPALQELSPDTTNLVKRVITGALSSSLQLVLTIFNLALLPVFVFFILRDWDRTVARVRGLIPQRYHAIAFPLVSQIDERLAGFVRGQITVCLVLAVLYSAGLWLFTGIDMPFVVGGLAGLLFIVPYLGTATGILLGSMLALLQFGFDWHILAVWAVFAVVQGIEGFVLTPFIVGDKTGLSPLVVMIALIVGGSLLGVWGMLLAIPITAALSVLLGALVEHYRQSGFFND
jgi:predicted PurR-regulated permease PerM